MGPGAAVGGVVAILVRNKKLGSKQSCRPALSIRFYIIYLSSNTIVMLCCYLNCV
jgi:hypothetical protein